MQQRLMLVGMFIHTIAPMISQEEDHLVARMDSALHLGFATTDVLQVVLHIVFSLESLIPKFLLTLGPTGIGHPMYSGGTKRTNFHIEW